MGFALFATQAPNGACLRICACCHRVRLTLQNEWEWMAETLLFEGVNRNEFLWQVRNDTEVPINRLQGKLFPTGFHLQIRRRI